ncbi:hypothetical protein SGL43_00387 [Streptomyces globisporus]|uniref:C2H2-type domain-containing protein n=1 Tax=Streptomyces globisporus TaxID=1908 RepID=A0ABM9GPT2_STRGL|nr:hypothetical protein SGL43_00387 [Streptomyces globisporus]
MPGPCAWAGGARGPVVPSWSEHRTLTCPWNGFTFLTHRTVHHAAQHSHP